MLTYLKLGKKGNLGNQLFQIASTIGIANKNNHQFSFPKWKYSIYFDFNFPLIDEKLNFQIVQEESYDYSNIDLPSGNYNLNGWFQSEKYFDISLVKNSLKFKPFLVNQVNEKYKNIKSNKNILISVRRGDFVNHPKYFQLDYRYYFLALTQNFPDWNKRTLIFTSDDINYCRRHFQFLENSVFVDNLNSVEQLVLATFCDDFVISNSTFSWWQAWIGEKRNSTIIRPIQNFRGSFRDDNNDQDFFPKRWVMFNSKSVNICPMYIKLVLKGEFYKLLENINFYYIFIKKEIKRDIKKTIGRK